MDAQQAEAASALAACDEGPEARCPLWRQVQEEARSMVRPTCLLVVLQDRTCFKHVEHTFLRIIHVDIISYVRLKSCAARYNRERRTDLPSRSRMRQRKVH